MSVAGPLTCRFRDILFSHNPYKMELSEKAYNPKTKLMFVDFFSLIPRAVLFTGQLICRNQFALQPCNHTASCLRHIRFSMDYRERRKTHLGILYRFRQVGGTATNPEKDSERVPEGIRKARKPVKYRSPS